MSKLVSLRRDRYYSSKELSKLFRVNESTIKRWADSGKLNCFKTPGGHRKYTPEQISKFIEKYQYDLLPSTPDFSDHVESETLRRRAANQDLHALGGAYLANAFRAETNALVDILWNSYRSGSTLVKIYDEIIGETIREMFRRWREGKLSNTEEHIVANTISESILQFRLLVPNGVSNGKIAVCGSFTNSFQEVILHAVTHVLETAGWKVYGLGSWVPTEVFVETIQRYSPKLVCASSEGVTEEEEVRRHNGEAQNDQKPLIEAVGRINAQVLLWNFEGSGDEEKQGKLLQKSLLIFSTFTEMLTLVERIDS